MAAAAASRADLVPQAFHPGARAARVALGRSTCGPAARWPTGDPAPNHFVSYANDQAALLYLIVPRDATPPAPDVVADRLHSAAIHLLRRLRHEDWASGLSPARLSALSVLVFGGSCTLGDRARAEGVRPPTMTRLVQGLEREGLVERSPDSADRRLVRLRATADGERVLHEGRRRRVARLAAALAALGDADRAQLARAVEVLERVLDAPPC